MNSRKMIKRLVITAVVIVAAISAYQLLAPKIKLMGSIGGQYTSSGASEIYLTPTGREIMKIEDASSTEVVAFRDMRFISPWGKPEDDNIDSANEQGSDEKESKIAFENGISIIIRDKSDSALSSSYLRTSTSEEKELVSKYFGKDKLKTDFDMNKAILESSPDDISFFKSVDEIAARKVMLKYKLFMPLNNISKIYIFELDNVKGFQFGIPENNDTVQMLLYSPDDNEYSMAFIGDKLTQDDIDMILKTMEFK